MSGVSHLCLLAEHTYLCVGSNDVPCPQRADLTPVAFTGPHPAGLPGTHMHWLAARGHAWHVDYADVVAVGELALQGAYSMRREVSVGAAPEDPQPVLLDTLSGAAVEHLLPAGRVPAAYGSGSPLAPQADVLSRRYLGRYDHQAWYLPQDQPDTQEGGVAARLSGLLAGRLLSLRRGRHLPEPLAQGGNGAVVGPGMLITDALETIWPLRTPPAALLRALLSQDVDTAATLGAAMLAPEDLALCAYVCPVGIDYGAALLQTQGVMNTP